MTKFLLFLIAVLLVSCQKDELPKFSIIPYIEFRNIEFTEGEDVLQNPVVFVNLILDYTDGDSNMGAPPQMDITPVPNCEVTLYKKSNGTFILTNTVSNPFFLIIPDIQEPHRTYYSSPVTLKSRSMYEGELQIEISNPISFGPYYEGDTAKFTVQITDRDDNKSNIAELEKVFSY
ncbi:MAG: hypothetical protein ABFS35_18190 [Bacteroidota bacterium]